jgi:16S rRNA (guanine966-N2)-methyltransferase
MRIIAGTAGGIPIKVPQGDTRPTTDRVREALFSMLGATVTGARVLDLFAGSGSLGLEALSRGAESALFVEQNRAAAQVLQANLEKTRLHRGLIRQTDAFRAVSDLARAGQQFDLIFADPPYAHRPSDTDLTLTLLDSKDFRQVVADDGSILLESRVTRDDFPQHPGWHLVRQRDYGTTRILWLQKTTETPAPSEPSHL